MAKVDKIIKTDISKLLGSVTNDIKKDFETTDFSERDSLTFLSTGSPGINYAMSGKFDGGFPEGLITELYGENSTGKTLLALHALVETQKKGGVACIIDAEFAFNADWYKGLGGDPDTLIHYEPDYIQKVYEFVTKLTETVRKRDKKVPITIVYDSVAASPSKHEFEGAEHDMGKRAQAHGKGIRMLMGLCKQHNITFIAINQLRHTFAMYGLDKDTIGGMAWKYATSLRVRLKKGKKIEEKLDLGKRIVGIKGALVIEKSRLRAPFATGDFNIYFEKGIDPLSGLFDVCKTEGVIEPRKKEGGGVSRGWYTYKDIHFQESNFVEKVLSVHPELLGGHDLIEAPTDISIEGGKEEEDPDDLSIIESEDGDASVEADM